MNNIWVVNASPLIALSKIGRPDLLDAINRTVLIPNAVSVEIENGPPDDPARQYLAQAGKNQLVPVTLESTVIEWGLGAGETAVLSLSKQMGAMAVIDDRAARTAAKMLGIRFIGTLGVVILAFHEKRITSTVGILKALQGVNLRLSDHVIKQALEQTTGEKWPG